MAPSGNSQPPLCYGIKNNRVISFFDENFSIASATLILKTQSASRRSVKSVPP